MGIIYFIVFFALLVQYVFLYIDIVKKGYTMTWDDGKPLSRFEMCVVWFPLGYYLIIFLDYLKNIRK